MFCEVCKITTQDGAILHRQNKKGEPGIFRCEVHNTRPIDPIIFETTSLIQHSNNKGKNK